MFKVQVQLEKLLSFLLWRRCVCSSDAYLFFFFWIDVN